jgi:hypothetical protein
LVHGRDGRQAAAPRPEVLNVKRLSFAILLTVAVSACGSSGGGKPAAGPKAPTTVATTTTTAPSGPTPFAVLKAESDALNRGDVAGSVAYFAPNAVLITELGGCNPCVGRETIREHWSGAAASQSHLTVSDPRTVGNIVTVRSAISSPQFPTGIHRAVGTAVAEVTDGKITRLEQRYDHRDPQTAALLAIVTGARSQATTSTP